MDVEPGRVTEDGEEKCVVTQSPMHDRMQQVTACSISTSSSSPPVGVMQSVPAGAIAAVPLVHVQNRHQMSPVLVPSASSAFQVTAPTTPQQTQCISTGAAMTVASSMQQSVVEAPTETANSNGHAPGLSHSSKVLMQSAQSTQTPQLVASGSSSISDRLPSPALQAPAAVSSLPPGSFYFMLPNNAGSVPTIAPRPASSEALTSPPVVTTAVRPDGSPVAVVASSPLSPMDESPSLTPVKRTSQAGSPRESKRRAIHNEVERRRRDKINFWMNRLKEIVPNPTMGGGANTSKGHVLGKAVSYITELKDELAMLQKRYESEHNQLLQCASQHTLLRQQLMDSSLKPAFGFFKIVSPAPSNGGPMGQPGLAMGGDSKIPELLAVSVPAGVMATPCSDVSSPAALSPSAMAQHHGLAHGNRFVHTASLSSVHPPPAITAAQVSLSASLAQPIVLSPPPLTSALPSMPAGNGLAHSVAPVTMSVALPASSPPALTPGLVGRHTSNPES